MSFFSFLGREANKKLLFHWLLYFLAIHSIVIFAISFKYLKYIELNSGFFVRFYFIISYLSHFLLLSLSPLVLLMLLAFFRISSPIIKTTAIILSLIVDSIIMADAIVFDLYRFHINGFVLELVFGGAASQIFNIPTLQYFFTFLYVVLFIGILILIAKLTNKIYQKRNLFISRILIPTTLILLVFSHLIHAWADTAAYNPITKISRFYPLYFPLRAPELFYSLGIIDKNKIEKNKIRFNNEVSKDLHYPISELQFKTSDSICNVILIVIDSWHHATMNSMITPHINNLALKSQHFINHNSGSNGTRGGIFSLFYGIPALYWEDMLSTGTSPVLISSFQKKGYDLSIHASSALSSPPFDRTVFSSVPNLKIGSEGKTSCERDLNLTKDFIHYVDSVEKIKKAHPFFAFLFYDAPHAIEHPDTFKCKFKPEWPNPKYLSLQNNTDPTPFFNLYKNAVNYDDMLIGMVLKRIEAAGLMENTIVIITGDHGQEFNDNKKNYWGHNGNFTRAQIGVPLIFYIPHKAPAVYNYQTLHYDISPTIMQLVLGCKNKTTEYSCGLNLFDTTERQNFVVGSRENFGIISSDQITTVFPGGNYSITDKHMNEQDHSQLDKKTTFKTITEINRFYKTQKLN